MKNRALKEKAHFLRGEERKHRALLEEAYARQFPDVELVLPAQSLVPRVKELEGELNVSELLALAMEAEQASESLYADLARRSQSDSARAMFQHLSRMENSHLHLLRVEHDLLAQFPDYYNVEEFHFGDELIHLGP